MNKNKSLIASFLVAIVIIATPAISFADKNDKDNDNKNGQRIKVEQRSEIKAQNNFFENFSWKGDLEFRKELLKKLKEWSKERKEILKRERKSEKLENKYLENKYYEEDEDKEEYSQSNLTPIIEGITSPTVLKVNEVGTWKVKASDPKNGALTYEVLFGDNETTKPLSLSMSKTFVQTGTFTHSYANKGTYKIKFIVSNEAGLKTVSTVTVHVIDDTDKDTAPVIKNITGLKTVKVGETETVTINAYDPNNKTLSYSADWGDGMIISNKALIASKINPVFVQTATLSHVYAKEGTYTATFTVQNSNGEKDTVSKKIIVTPITTTDTIAPIMKNIKISTDISNNATISWETNEKATGEIFYSTKNDVDIDDTNTLVVSDKTLKKEHSLNIPGLASSTLYHFILKSADASNNVTLSSEITFVTN